MPVRHNPHAVHPLLWLSDALVAFILFVVGTILFGFIVSYFGTLNPYGPTAGVLIGVVPVALWMNYCLGRIRRLGNWTPYLVACGIYVSFVIGPTIATDIIENGVTNIWQLPVAALILIVGASATGLTTKWISRLLSRGAANRDN